MQRLPADCLHLAPEIFMGGNDKDLSNSEQFIRRLCAAEQSAVLEEVASGVAHEINQSLAAMATFSHAGERMLDRPVPLLSRALEVFRDISREALGAGARLQTIRRSLTRQPVAHSRHQVADLVTEMRPILNSWALHFGSTLMFEEGSNVSDVIVDRLKIQHVLLALVKNALESVVSASASREVTVGIKQNRYTVEISVTNPGSKLPKEIVAHLFQPFFTTKSQGAGLGLASSRAIIESHEGTIGFENVEPAGVRFWFRLPIAVGGV
jgi:two-component system sensor kinase FixL